MNLKPSTLALALAAALASGCAVGPDYRRPEVAVPEAWRQASEAGEAAGARWWERFRDPVLAKLVHEALEGNKDLAIAAANVDQAFARYGSARSALYPRVDAGGSAARLHSGSASFNDHALELTAGFEIDLWGRLRRANESARAHLLASEEDRRTVVLTLVAAVANGYIRLRALDRQLEIAANTAQSLGEAARLQRIRFREGAVPESDYRQSESQHQGAAAQVPELERLVARQENFLSTLAGRNPGPIERGRTIDALAFPPPPQGLPAELLERRPDIRRAELQLIAANADIGAAKASLFPRIGLTGLLGSESGELSELLKRASRTWLFGIGIAQPIFNAGRLRNQVAESEALQRGALAAYEKAIIAGFQEVEDALVDRAKLEQAREAQARNVAALQRFRDLASLRYREGATFYLEVSRAEESLFNAQLALVATQAQLFQSYASLYKAMGGGWSEL